ncbi:hypothetical protein NKI51_11680 [Mesorhizobium australicum]|uniref:hypothetical protein n=1 Tax=Mesorhizobium australicum TaxID=536018 RepID=UPI00333BD7F9
MQLYYQIPTADARPLFLAPVPVGHLKAAGWLVNSRRKALKQMGGLSVSTPNWPWYLPGWHDDIYAIGMIGLNYSQLETAFRHLFTASARMSAFDVDMLFERKKNDARLQRFDQLYNRPDIHELYKDLRAHFATGYKVCADNRNSIMHSSFNGRFVNAAQDRGGIVLAKYSKSGQQILCPVTLEDLRRVADEIHDFSMFGFSLASDTESSLKMAAAGNPSAFVPRPSIDKPPMPQALIWRPLGDRSGDV